MTFLTPKFPIGSHVEEPEELGLCKVVNILFEEDGHLYHLRQFAHPHKMKWVDKYHIGWPTQKRHDPKLDHHWDLTDS